MDHSFKMDRSFYLKGIPSGLYLQQLRNYRSLVRKLVEKAEINELQLKRLKDSAENRGLPLVATAMTEDWCGDWVCNLPILSRLFEQTEIDFRVFRGSEYPEFREYYRSSGDTHIPAVSIWDHEGNEAARWIEAPGKVQMMKDEWKKRNPEMMELYAVKEEDKKAAKRFAKLYREFLEDMAVWYSDEHMWDETIREITEALIM